MEKPSKISRKHKLKSKTIGSAPKLMRLETAEVLSKKLMSESANVTTEDKVSKTKPLKSIGKIKKGPKKNKTLKRAQNDLLVNNINLEASQIEAMPNLELSLKDTGKDSVMDNQAPLLSKQKKRKKLNPKSSPWSKSIDSGKQAIERMPVLEETEDSKKDIGDVYPVLKDEQLVKKFLSVKMTNNQKGRIRQVLKDLLKGTPAVSLPDIIHNRIQTILKRSENLTDTDLRKIRVLYNMLKTSTESDAKLSSNSGSSDGLNKKSKKVSQEMGLVPKNSLMENTEDVNSLVTKEENKKVKGPKRYVVFLGNLPLDVTKEQITEHFYGVKDYIKNVRVPVRAPAKTSAIAYLELSNELAYEIALAKHHTMLGNKRMNVLYTAQKKPGSEASADVKGKSAKLTAMARAGQLAGSIPLHRKRSHRRAKQRQALALAEAAKT